MSKLSYSNFTNMGIKLFSLKDIEFQKLQYEKHMNIPRDIQIST